MLDAEPEKGQPLELEYGSPEIKLKVKGLLDRFERVFLRTPEFRSAITDSRGSKEFKLTKGSDAYEITYRKSTDGKDRALDVRVFSSQGEDKSIFLEAGSLPDSEILYVDGKVSIIDILMRRRNSSSIAIRGIEKILGKLEQRPQSASRKTSNNVIIGPLGPMPLPGGRSPWGGIK